MVLKDQVAIITGAGSGIGAATAEVFAQAQIAGLTIADVKQDAAEDVARSIEERHGCRAVASGTDVSDPDQVEKMVSDTIREFGRLDILVNNAGICPMISWDVGTLDHWNHILAVNLTGAYLCTRAAVPHMLDNQYGRVVFISSVGAFQGSVVAHPAYGVSKAGMIALMKSVAKEFATKGITSNAIAPGTINTPITDSFSDEIKQHFVDAAPMRRQGSPEELADAVLFLVSNRSSYVTGATLHVNGGSLIV